MDTKIIKIDVGNVITNAIKIPMVKIDRDSFLKKELSPLFSDTIVHNAIEFCPAYAGINLDTINKLANASIDIEATKVSALSFVAGVPGGLAMIGTIPADITQYFVFVLRIIQKLAYLYSFPDFNLSENGITDELQNHLIVFIGVMFGANSANIALKSIAESLSKKTAKTLANKALTKGTIYPIVKNISKALGIRMTKQIFANTVSKVIPVIGGAASGLLSYATFKPSALRLKNSLCKMPICQPNFHENTVVDSDAIDIEC